MTGIGWVDATALVAFAMVTVLAFGRLTVGWRRMSDRGDVAVHGVMAAGMAAMSRPCGTLLPARAWMAVFVAVGLWSALVVGHRAWPRLTEAGRSLQRRAWRQRIGGAVHHLVAEQGTYRVRRSETATCGG